MLQFFYMHAFDDSGKHNTIILGAALFLIAAPLEICRLYLGYSANLREMVCHCWHQIKLRITQYQISISNINFGLLFYFFDLQFKRTILKFIRIQIADFAGFLILSTFIQQPIEIYFYYIVHKAKIFWLQIYIQMFMTILVLLQIIIGYGAMRRMTQLKAQQFHILTLIDQSNKIRQ